MIQTSTGYKVTFANQVTDTVEGVKSINDFFKVMDEEGFWYAVTGNYFDEWFLDVCKSILQFIVDMSDILIVAGLIILLIIMFGSKRATTWLYWTICSYLIIKALGLMV